MARNAGPHLEQVESRGQFYEQDDKSSAVRKVGPTRASKLRKISPPDVVFLANSPGQLLRLTPQYIARR